jgi:uncharacterized protein YbjT (DUF2867 family)
MVSVADVGVAAAEALLAPRAGPRVVEIEGPRASSPEDAAAAFSEALGRRVSVALVPEADWPAALQQWRFSPVTVASWVELFQAFNSGRIAFERSGSAPVTGRVSLRAAIDAIVRGTPGP